MVDPGSPTFDPPSRIDGADQDLPPCNIYSTFDPMGPRGPGSEDGWTISGFSRAMGPIGFVACLGVMGWALAGLL